MTTVTHCSRVLCNTFRFWRSDPRHYQSTVLTSLLVYGIVCLDLEVELKQLLVIIPTALLTQYVCSRVCKLPRFDPRSALISANSLCLLLRTNHLWLMAFTALVTILSKFTLHWNGKHIFNPTFRSSGDDAADR
jgi:Na+-transporting NADH:ubiquinone oxidoreductase subunit NqrB